VGEVEEVRDVRGGRDSFKNFESGFLSSICKWTVGSGGKYVNEGQRKCQTCLSGGGTTGVTGALQGK